MKTTEEKIEQLLKGKTKERALKLYKLLVLSYPRYTTRKDIGVFCEIYNDRNTRKLISELKKIAPIIATSDNTGYKIALNKNDLVEVAHTWKELDSRIEELEAAKQPLIDFYDLWRD